jgi:imidazolonepropionase-like amidohydrolase
MRTGRDLSRASLVTTLVLATAALGAAPQTTPPAGLREIVPRVHAIVGAKIVVSPDKTIESGTIVVRDGVIVAVGDKVAPPADARIWNAQGKTLYPGLIDAMSELSDEASRGGLKDGSGAEYWNPNIVPHVRADERYSADAALNRKLRSQGITSRLVAPSAGIIKGTSALVSAGEGAGKRATIKDQVALHLKLTVARGSRGYPNSPMGAYTLVRQAFYDAGWYGQAWNAFRQNPELPRPERSDALEVLQAYPGRKPLVVIETGDELYALRAERIATEFQLNAIILGSGDEYKLLDEIKAVGRPVIVPVNFPKAPNVATPEAALNVSLDRLMHWDLAPENPGRLAGAGVKIALTSRGLRDTGTFLAAVRKAVKRGLKSDAALRALTVTPAELFDAGGRLGTLEVGKAANIVVASGPLFDAKTKVLETWVDGDRHEVEAEPQADLRGTWAVDFVKPDGQQETLSLEITGRPGKLSGKITRGDKSTPLVAPQLNESQFVASFKGKPLGFEGVLQLSGTVSKPALPGAAVQPAGELAWLGVVVWADQARTVCTAKRTAGPKPEQPDDGKATKKEGEAEAAGQKEVPAAEGDKKPAAESKEEKPEAPTRALAEVNFPLGEFGRKAPPDQPRHVLFRNATIWTSGPQGRMEKTDLLVESGKVRALGAGLALPDGAVVIDAAGKHISPGIIDCHSHSATDGGVNESAQTITAEVRVGDFIDPTDINIYRQLAGGVTAANILHGSANTIGGQNQVIKFRWGAVPEAMKLAIAPPGIKFALGENVKQSNRADRAGTRYPQTRMGVEQLIRDAFQAARQYRADWDAWNRTRSGLPPRVDLELEALAEVLEGKRLVHCHSYRQDEILALLRTCESFNVHIATFQHILEGYKVADALARHGAGASSFSDWWAFKFEVFDAIPYNGSILHDAGVVVSFNSDNSELARRLNLEAAKAVKYGGVAPEEALKFVTLNPARQLKIEAAVGSLEPGKDADLVVWSGPPLSAFSRCEQTWVDGRRYFDAQEDRQHQAEANSLRAALVQRILASDEPRDDGTDAKKDDWPREDIFCEHGDHLGHNH